MEFSVGVGRGDRIDQIADYVRTAEESGFSHVAFADMPFMNRDIYVMMTIAALNTHRIHIGQAVTDPLTYHPSVIANATATINELSGGRAFVGLGVGGPYGKAMKPISLNELRQAVEFIKRYTAGEEAEWKGARMHSEWVRRPLPVYMAVDGPKACELAGEIADGIIFLGVHPEYVRWRMELMERGAARAGRDPSKIDVWARTIVSVADSKEAARREIRPYLAGFEYIYRSLQRETPQARELRRRLERADRGLVDTLVADYERYYGAEGQGRPKVGGVPWGEVVTQRTIDFFYLTGTPDDICEGISKLAKAGVKNISTVLYTVKDSRVLMREIGDEIMPRFRS